MSRTGPALWGDAGNDAEEDRGPEGGGPGRFVTGVWPPPARPVVYSLFFPETEADRGHRL